MREIVKSRKRYGVHGQKNLFQNFWIFLPFKSDIPAMMLCGSKYLLAGVDFKILAVYWLLWVLRTLSLSLASINCLNSYSWPKRWQRFLRNLKISLVIISILWSRWQFRHFRMAKMKCYIFNWLLFLKHDYDFRSLQKATNLFDKSLD